jgi:chromosomal replication initiation ATPase DnaA
MSIHTIDALAERIERLERAWLPGDETRERISLDATHGVRELVRFVAFQTGVRTAEIVGPQRCRRVFRARAAVVWASIRLLGKSYSVVGRVLGDRDHTTIINAVRRAEEMRRIDPAFGLLCGRLEAAFPKEVRQ